MNVADAEKKATKKTDEIEMSRSE